MTSPASNNPDGSVRSRPRGLAATVSRDLREANVRRDLRRDLSELYEFYVDEDQRERLARMGPLRRWLKVAGWLVRSLILNLTPTRRLMLVVSMVGFFLSAEFVLRVSDSVSIGLPNLRGPAYALLLAVLALELKDKLLARDELQVGRRVQLALLPADSPQLAGWEVWIYTRPANDVGGDLVDYLRLAPERLGIALGDVAGKGLGAALLMSKLQATLRALAPDFRSLVELGTRVNTILCRDGLANRFATLVYLEIESGSDTVRLLNAGHLPPMIVRAASGAAAARGNAPPPLPSAGAPTAPPIIETLEAPAMPLGVMSDALFHEQRLDLAPGDTLVVYSDGLTEAQDAAGRFYGEERLRGLARTLSALPVAAAGMTLLADVEQFVGESRLADDLSLVLLRRTVDP